MLRYRSAMLTKAKQFRPPNSKHRRRLADCKRPKLRNGGRSLKPPASKRDDSPVSFESKADIGAHFCDEHDGFHLPIPIRTVGASCALFLILELSRPFSGLMVISSSPLRHALGSL